MINTNNQEQEVKFMISRPVELEQRLVKAGAVLKNPRTFEANLRFDTPGGDLTRAARVLRLRRDERVRLTYKGPNDPSQGISNREEIEFEVSSFDNALAFLEALGYQVSVRYEKYRTTYQLGTVEVTLDELPYGTFAEIEGPGLADIQSAAAALGLNWEARSVDSYLGLFYGLVASQGLQARHLTFAEVPLKYPPSAFGLQAADQAA